MHVYNDERENMQDIETILGCDFAAHYYHTLSGTGRVSSKDARTMRGYTQDLKERYPGIRAPLNLYVLHWLDTYGAMPVDDLEQLFSGVVSRTAIHTALSSLARVERVHHTLGGVRLYSSTIAH